MHIDNNSVFFHYLYNMEVGLVIYSKTRAFKAKARETQGQGQEICIKAKAKD